MSLGLNELIIPHRKSTSRKSLKHPLFLWNKMLLKSLLKSSFVRCLSCLSMKIAKCDTKQQACACVEAMKQVLHDIEKNNFCYNLHFVMTKLHRNNSIRFLSFTVQSMRTKVLIPLKFWAFTRLRMGVGLLLVRLNVMTHKNFTGCTHLYW